MTTTSFNRFDLNLLRIFHAVMEERSVLRASQRICLSQTAVSHALARLREMLHDELFIRTTTGMQPTARALAMAPLIRDAWGSLEAAVGLPKFEPATSTRLFTIAASDFVTTLIAPHLLGLLRQEAPQVDLIIRPESRIDLAEQIDLGHIDAAIGTFSGLPPRFRSESLFCYDDVLIASSCLGLGKLSLEKLAGLSIAAISMHGEAGLVDGVLCERGLERRSEMYDRVALDRAFAGSMQSPRLAVLLPHFLALPSVLKDSHLAAIVPRPLARELMQKNQLSVHELPYRSDLVDVGILWHARNTGDAPQEWLRDMLRRSARGLRPHQAEHKRVTCRNPPGRAQAGSSAAPNNEEHERETGSLEVAEPC